MIGALIAAVGLSMAGAMDAQASAPPAAGKPQPIAPAKWMTPDDYPVEALRANEQGAIGFVLEVDAKGIAKTCRVTSGAEAAILSKATCKILLERAKFVPAKDKAGKPIASAFESRFRWEIPGGLTQSKFLVAIEETAGGYRCSLNWKKRRRTLTSDVCKSLAENVVAAGRKLSKPVVIGSDDPTPLLDPEQP